LAGVLVLALLLEREFGLDELLLDLFRLPFLPPEVLAAAAAGESISTGLGGSATTRSIVRKRALQQGHLFSVSAHLSIQSKQNLCVQPLIEAASVREAGVSKQIAQVKSATGSTTAAATATGTFAAGFKSKLSIPSSSSASTMGEPFAFGTGGSSVVAPAAPPKIAVAFADLAAAAPPLIGIVDNVNVPLLLLLLLMWILLLRAAKRVERRWGANSWAIRVVAFIAARRVDRRAGAGEAEVVPTEKEGVTMMMMVWSLSQNK